MRYARLGGTGLLVSEVGLGTVAWGLASSDSMVDLKTAEGLLDAALDAGINLVDTANVYGNGASETFLGKLLTSRREKVVLASKVRFSRDAGPNAAGLSRQQIIAACEASLRRLATDRIDLYQLHGWDGQTPLEETMEALDTLIRSGKVRYLGCSNFSGWHLMKALGISERERQERFASQQIHYNVLSREAEHELLPIAIDQGVATLVWGPLASGLLSGRVNPRATDFPTTVSQWREPPINDVTRLRDVLQCLARIADETQSSVAQVALAWLLGRPGVTSVLVGSRSIVELDGSVRSLDLALTADQNSRLDRASATALPYPYWHQARTLGDRLSAADRVALGQ